MTEKITIERETFEAWVQSHGGSADRTDGGEYRSAPTECAWVAWRAALAQQAGKCSDGGDCGAGGYCAECRYPAEPPAPAAVPLTDEQIAVIRESQGTGVHWRLYVDIVRHVERAHGIGNKP